MTIAMKTFQSRGCQLSSTFHSHSSERTTGFMASLKDSMPLEQRIQQLPQELQDQILDAVLSLATANAKTVLITAAYRPPWQISVDRRTRKKQARDYYANSVFQSTLHDWMSWIKSIPVQYQSLVKEIRVRVAWHPWQAAWSWRSGSSNLRCQIVRNLLIDQGKWLEKNGISLGDNVLKQSLGGVAGRPTSWASISEVEAILAEEGAL